MIHDLATSVRIIDWAYYEFKGLTWLISQLVAMWPRV
jgi:hypothetical protein